MRTRGSSSTRRPSACIPKTASRRSTCGGCRSAGACWTLCITPRARPCCSRRTGSASGPKTVFPCWRSRPAARRSCFCSGPSTRRARRSSRTRCKSACAISSSSACPARARRPSAACWRSGWAATFSTRMRSWSGASAAISRHFSRARARLPSAQRRRPCWPSWASAPAASSPRAAAASSGRKTSRCCGRTLPSSGCSARLTGCPSPGGP